jgi:Zn-dependent protease
VTREFIAMLPLWYVVFLLSVTCHEAAHALAGYLGGDETAYRGGQVSLNPIPHVLREPLGTVIVPIASYLLYGGTGFRWMIGWASAPYDPAWEDRHPKRAAWMALAGPAANLVLAAIAFFALKVGLAADVWGPFSGDAFQMDRLVSPMNEGTGILDGVGRFCSVLLGLNILLFLFNLLPLPPMDGAAVLAGFFRPARALRERMRGNPMLGLLGLLLAWQVFPMIFGPIYSRVLALLFA